MPTCDSLRFRRRALAGATLVCFAGLFSVAPALCQDDAKPPTTAERPMHGESAEQHDGPTPPEVEDPPIPDGMTLDEVLDRAGSPPPRDFPDVVDDDALYTFTLVELLEYRLATDDGDDHLGWEAQGWVGYDFDKFWWKLEGEAAFAGTDEGETALDLLYARLISPFWNVQAGAQYAVEWAEGDSEDRWSAVVAIQGLVPYKFELDVSNYLSEDGDLTTAVEAEYDVRITQRLVLQPLVALGIAFQEVPERRLGSGLTDGKLDLRLRYELRRELAPYLGVRYRFLAGDTEELAEAAGEDSDRLFVFAGLRFAF